MDPAIPLLPPDPVAGNQASYNDPIEAGVVKRLREAGVGQTVTTWAQLAGWVRAVDDVGELLRILRVTRDVKAFRGPFEALIVPLLCARIKPAAPVDCRVSEPAPLGVRLNALGVASLRHVLSWPEVVELLRAGQVPDLGPAPGPGTPPAEWQQLALLAAAVAGEAGGAVPSPMLNGCVALGVELQDMGSAAVQCLDADLTTMLSQCATLVQTDHCGTDGHWRLVTDGANLEYILVQTMLVTDLVMAFIEIEIVHTWLRKVKPGVYRVGDEIIVICENGTTGRSMVTENIQPQFNFELPLDMLCDAVAAMVPQHTQYKHCFGATGYYWTPSRTDNEIAACQRLAVKLQQLQESVLARVLGPAAAQDAGAVQQVRGLMLLFGMAAIHAQFAKPDEPPKDMPILCKTNPVRLFHELVLSGVLARPAGGKAACDAMFAALNTVLTKGDREAMPSIRALFISGTHPVRCSVDVTPQVCVGSPRWTSTHSRRQVLLEIRRAPVGAVTPCLVASLSMLEHFVIDLQRRYS